MPFQEKMEIRRNEINLARESNELIEAKYKLDIWEARLFLAALAQIKVNDIEFKKYKIRIKDFRDKYGITDNDVYARINKAAKTLRKKDITIPYQYEEGMGEFTTGLITGSGSMETDGDGSFIAVDIHPDLKPYLLQLKERFTQYNVLYLMQMPSAYSRMVYKLLKQYMRIGKRRFTVEKLREMLCVENHEYPKYSNFKQKVILKAQLDLPKYTDIRFDFKEEKKGRRVHTIEFLIYPNEPSGKTMKFNRSSSTNSKEKTLSINALYYQEVKSWGVSPASVDEWIQKYGNNHLELSVKYIKNRLDKGDKIKNKAGYLNTILKNENLKDDIQEQKQESEVKKVQRAKKQQVAKHTQMARRKKEEEYGQKKQTIIDDLIKLQPELLAKAYEVAKKNPLFSSSFDPNKKIEENYHEKAVVKAAMDSAIQELYPDFFKGLSLV